MHPFTINSTLAHTNPRNEVFWFYVFFKSIDVFGLKKIKFYCAHFFTPLWFSSTPKTSYKLPMFHVLKEEEWGGRWGRVLGTINLSPSWPWNLHQFGRNSSLSRQAKVACPSFNLWLTRRCQKHAQNMTSILGKASSKSFKPLVFH